MVSITANQSVFLKSVAIDNTDRESHSRYRPQGKSDGRLTVVSPVLVPFVVDSGQLEHVALLAQLLDRKPAGEHDHVEHDRDCDKVSGKDERMLEASRDEAEDDGQDEGNSLRLQRSNATLCEKVTSEQLTQRVTT